MTFFSKKNCDICGEKIGLLGNKKLDDGNMCKVCAKKLSPWFNERRNSTLFDINEQLAYREENKKKVSEFKANRGLGSRPNILIDDEDGRFMVSYDDDYTEENPDVISISDVTECVLDIDERQKEIMQHDKDGREISHMIRRYDYSYDFYIDIKVNNPYFDTIRFKLNTYSIDGNSRQEYEKFKQMGEEICTALKGVDSRVHTGDSASSSSNVAFCPHCGTPTKGEGSNFCASCGKPLSQ